MNSFKSLANFAGILNSLAIISLIMNQNDSSKDQPFMHNKIGSIAESNPLRYFTGLLLFLQLSFLLFKIKLDVF